MIKRILQEAVQKELFQGKIIILYGARQVGKTTLSKLILDTRKEDGKYLNCDLLPVRQALETEDAEKLKKYLGDSRLVILDEAQRVKNIGLNLKIIHDHLPDIQIIATGSSSFDLARNISEPLTGRAFTHLLHPLSVEELHTLYDYSVLRDKLEHILRFGLYPDVFDKNESEAVKILNSISGSYLYKDILEFDRIKNPDQLIHILQLLALQIGNEVSYNEIARQTKLSVVTVEKYISLLEKTFVIFRLRGFSRNLRKEISKSVKIYFWDLGIRNALIQNFNPVSLRTDTGALWENFFIAERLKYLNNHQKFVNSYFWRTYDQKEIDYLEESGGELRGFECKWNAGKKSKVPKEFLETYPNSSSITITPENFDEYVV